MNLIFGYLLLVLRGRLFVVQLPEKLRMFVVTELPLDHLEDVLLLLLQAVHVLLLHPQGLLHLQQLHVELVQASLLPHNLRLQVSLQFLRNIRDDSQI